MKTDDKLTKQLIKFIIQIKKLEKMQEEYERGYLCKESRWLIGE